MTTNIGVTAKQGAMVGGWVCLGLGTILMVWSLFLFFLYGPLFLAAFVLGIVSIAQKRIANGVAILLFSVVIPLIFGVGLGAYRTKQVLDEVKVAQRVAVSSPVVNAAESQSTSTLQQPTAAELGKEYIDRDLELYDFKAKYMDSVLDGRVPGVNFKIRNKGTEALNEVKVLVLFKDSSGNTIAEEEYMPVLVSKYNFGGDNKPLKPGYIWQQEKGKFFAAKAVPSEWKEGAAEARITKILFAKDMQ
jgi:hypothetical protein